MTRRMMLTGAAALAAATQLLAAPATYEIDSAHSSAQFKVKHMMISNVRGEFTKVAGTIVFDAANAGASKIDAMIPVTTINTREEGRDKHLKSADFFDVEKFPTATFKSTKVEAAGKGAFKVTGDLTLHGVTKPVVFSVENVTPEVKGMRGEMRMGAQATTRINRKDFGISWSRNMDGGGVVVSDEVDLTIDIEMVRK